MPKRRLRSSRQRASLLPILLAFAPFAAVAATVPVSTATANAAPVEAKRYLDEGNDPEIAGPRTGRVDPRFASPSAARETVKKLHVDHGHNHRLGRAQPSGEAAPTPADDTVRASAEPDATTAALDPAVYGQWETLSYPTQAPAIHVTKLHTGKVLLVSGSGNNGTTFAAGTFKAHVWDPKTGAMKSVTPPYDMFCSGHVVLPNGNVLVAGGTEQYMTSAGPWLGSNKAHIFDVPNERWLQIQPMKNGRWYPTALIDGSGRPYMFAGRNAVTGERVRYGERYNPSTNTWTTLGYLHLPDYPGLKLMADGRGFYTGTRTGNSGISPTVFDLATGAKTNIGGMPSLDRRNGAAAVLAGPAAKQWVAVLGGGFPATASTAFIDRPTDAAWRAGPNLHTPKGYVSALNLPNFEVLQTGGGAGTDSPVYESSIVNYWSMTNTPVAPNTVPRTYHSSAILLDDGRVATFGGDPSGDSTFELRIEIYSPPYLFKGTRPTLSSAPSTMTYGGTYTLGASASGTTFWSAALMRPASTTHATDGNERAVGLALTNVTGGVKVTVPTNRNLAPPGYYMLFLQDRLARVSLAKWVKIS